jgi:hypothetical protein
MKETERFDCFSIPHDGADHAITPIFAIAKSVTVLDPRVPAREIAIPGPDDVVHPYILPEYLAAPAIVVSCNPDDFHSRIAKLGKGG